MAERKLEVKILGDSRDLERAFGRATGSAKRFDRSMGSVGRAGAALAKGFAVAAAGVTALAVVGAREMQEQAKVSAQTAVVLRNVGKASQLTTKQVEGLASALQASTGAADDEVQSASNVILRFGLITKTGKAAQDQLEALTTTSLDLSVATGKDLNASAQALGRALASPEKAAGALRRAGIVLTAQQREQIKAMVESGDAAGAQAKVLDLVQSRVKGAAAEFGKTLPGQVERAKRSLEDLSENTLGALAPALAKLVPVIVKAIQGIAPVIAKVGSIIADLADELISNPAFQEFARTLRDIAIKGVNALAAGLRVVLPIVVAILAPIASLAAALTRSQAAMTALAAAVAAFVAVKATAYITGLVASIRALAITTTAASGMRALATTASALALGFQGVSAKAAGLAPGLTAAQGGLTRVGLAATAARGIFPQLGRAISGAFGGPVGIAIATGTALAVVIGGDLVRSFMQAKDPAERYAEAMREAASGTKAAKDSLEGLAEAILGGADAQDRTRESTKQRIIAEKELRNLEARGITSGPQYAAAVKRVSDARREEARSTLASRDATDLTQQKQNEARTTIDGLVKSLATARGSAMAGAAAITGFGVSGATARGQYQQFLQVANGKIMGSQELKNFQTQASSLAGVFRNAGTPAAREIATALDNVGKARTPEGVAKWAGELVRLMGGSKRDVEAAKQAMNGDLKNVGNVRPSSTFFSGLQGQISSLMDGLEGLARKIADVARKRMKGEGQRSNELASAALGGQPNRLSFFYSQRSAAAGNLGGLSSLAREGFMRRDPEAKAIAERRKKRQKDLDDLQKGELAKRITEATTTEERQRAQLEYDEFLDALTWARVENEADAHQQSIDDLGSQFERGLISAKTYKAELETLIGGDVGATNGQLFGERWLSAFEKALGTGPGSPLAAIIANALGGLTGAAPVDGPQPEAVPEAAPVGAAEKRTIWLNAARAFGRELERKYPRNKKNRDRLISQGWMDWYADHGRDPSKAKNLPGLARGGIVRGTTYFAGEAGAEAVIPLTGSRGRDYMTRVMADVSRRTAGTRVVNVTFNGVIDAKEAARRIKPEIDRIVSLA